jgi:hypothetical protein
MGIGGVMRTTRAGSTVCGQCHGPNLDGGANRPIAAHLPPLLFDSWCARSLTGHLNRGFDGVFEIALREKGANISQACKRTWTEFSGLGCCGHCFNNCAQLQLFGAGIARELFEDRATTR